MLKRTCAKTLDWVAGFVGAGWTREELRAWCLETCRSTLSERSTNRATTDETADGESSRIAELAGRLFAEEGFPNRVSKVSLTGAADLEQARNWLRDAPGGPRIAAAPLPQRFGYLLEALAVRGERPTALHEALLRHIEVRRADCLSDWGRRMSREECDEERLTVAVHLFREGTRAGDPRPISSGLKMLDWFAVPHLPGWRRLTRPLQVRILLAALEASAGLEEWSDA